MIEQAKKHGAAAAIAAVVSAGTVISVPTPPPTQVSVSVNASKHAWPDLTSAQKTIIASRATGLGVNVDILCGDASCTDLSQDIDDALEMAGVASSLSVPALPIGYGAYIGIPAGLDRSTAERLSSAIKFATDGTLDFPVRDGPSGTKIIVAIGKKPRI